MKRLLFVFVSLAFAFISLFPPPPAVFAESTCFDPKDSCTDLNIIKHCCSPVSGKRYSCKGQVGGSGGRGGGGVPTCQYDDTIPLEITCKCDFAVADQAGQVNGRNGFKCEGTNPKNQHVEKHTFCSTNVNCVDTPGAIIIAPGIWDGQSAKNVACLVVTDPPPTPPPPPCQHFGGNGGCDLVGSSIGGLNTQPGPFIIRIFNIVLAISGAIAVLLMMRAGYQLMTARGNPEGLQKGREQLIAAIVGLLFLIFSFVFFQVISVDLLKIPGFR